MRLRLQSLAAHTRGAALRAAVSSVCCAAALAVLVWAVWPPAQTPGAAEKVRAADQAIAHTPADEQPIDFNRDIRPILSDKCFACHGPDAAVAQDAGGFRLDRFETATARTASGVFPIKPGSAAGSEIIRRIKTDNPKLQMPPLSAKLAVTAEEAALLERWIDAGAHYQRHWAYEPVTEQPLPETKHAAWARSAIDLFIAARLERAGLSPSIEADRATLLRRLSLDLTGLPATPQEIDTFIKDQSPDAYEQQVDRLLASPHFGERMAVVWLDAARYADTIGYQLDHARNAWPWRNWVIDAFNSNMPYDRFIVEQLAGDLLPDATASQRLATAFCRMHMMNHEAGSIDEEYRVENVADRIETVATVFMAQTFNCARCHDHKYDPVSQDDYYALFAYFSSIPEKGVYTNKPEDAVAYAPRMDWIPPGTDDPEQAVPVSVMAEMDKPRQEYVLGRGMYNNKIKERPAERRPPDMLALPLPEGAPNNRLGFARWLVRPDHPLTARVHVNRIWQTLFGTGIVKTVEDFGSQAEWPSHPELLDYLAWEFVASGWDQKSLIKQIVMSATYRQRAEALIASAEVDPDNRLLSYFPRQRMSAEIIRDHALAVSGLLNKTVGGPSVRPYQPPGLWREVSMGPKSNTNVFKRDSGDKLYRRSLYTFIKRKSPPPQMASFGAPNREACVVRRDVTNTPMQALVLWNDEQFLEAARALAQRTLDEVPGTDARLLVIYRRCTGGEADERRLAVLRQALTYFQSRYTAAPNDAKTLLKQGEFPLPDRYDPAELASWMMVASVVLSSDETIVRD